MEEIHKVFLTRRVSFCASHRLHSSKLTDDENAAIYGKCNHINGHGHNYTAEVTLYGPVDSTTGMLMNLTDLKEYMEIAIMKHMDHKNLDADVEYFKKYPSTAENVAICIWKNMKMVMAKPELLNEVKVFETEKNIAIYKGDTSNQI